MRGKKIDEIISVSDWYATFCSLAGADPADLRSAVAKLPPVDSLNMWDLLSGKDSMSPRIDVVLGQTLQSGVAPGGWGLISNIFKILVGNVSYAGWTGPQYPNMTDPEGGITTVENCNEGCLYNIRVDPEERNNLNETMPDVLKEMQGKLKEHLKTFFNPDRGGTDPKACEAAIHKYGGYWGPWLP